MKIQKLNGRIVAGIVLLTSVAYTYFLTRHVISMHNQYMQMIDFGAYDQVVWSLSKHFSFESSICGSIMNAWSTIGAKTADAVPPLATQFNVLGIHFIPSLFFTVAIPNLIYNSTSTTYFMQTLAFSSSATLLFFILKARGVSFWVAGALAISFLIHPANIGANVNAFHPVVMALPFLFTLYFLAVTERYKAYWILFIFIGFIQENLWITLSAFSLFFFVEKKIKMGLLSLLAGLVMLVITTQVFIPHFNPSHICPYCSVYGSPLGGSMGEIIKNAILKPSVTLELLTRPHVLEWLKQLFHSTFYLSFLQPASFLVAVAGIVPNLLSTNKSMHIMWGQYNSLAMPFIYIGAGLGYKFLAIRFKIFRYSLVWAAVILFLSTSASKDWAVSNVTKPDYIFTSTPRVFAYQNMISSYEIVKSKIPEDASVSATELFLNSIGRRPQAYLFPVGFLDAEYVVFEKSNLTIAKENYIPRIEDVSKSGKYEIEFDDEHIQMWKKVSN